MKLLVQILGMPLRLALVVCILGLLLCIAILDTSISSQAFPDAHIVWQYIWKGHK